MDLSEYAGELFTQHGELHVAGLGYFARKRTGSYYEDGSMHPPAYKISFVNNADDDNDELINYFATQKRISPASAKYFVDKFVSQLKEQAQSGDVDFAGIGTFVTQNGELAFKPMQLNADSDPVFFGYTPVKIAKINQPRDYHILDTPSIEEAEAAENIEEDEARSDDVIPAVEQSPADSSPMIVLDSATGKEQNTNNNIFIWTTTLAIAALIIGGFVYYYLNYYNVNDRYEAPINAANRSYTTRQAKIPPGRLSAANRDTNNIKSALIHDSAAAPADKKAITPPAEDIALKPVKSELPLQSWIISGGQNNNYESAGRQVARYRALGYPQARLMDSVKKKDYFVYKIVFGVYDNRNQAVAERAQLLKQHKLKPKFITIQQINSNK